MLAGRFLSKFKVVEEYALHHPSISEDFLELIRSLEHKERDYEEFLEKSKKVPIPTFLEKDDWRDQTEEEIDSSPLNIKLRKEIT